LKEKAQELPSGKIFVKWRIQVFWNEYEAEREPWGVWGPFTPVKTQGTTLLPKSCVMSSRADSGTGRTDRTSVSWTYQKENGEHVIQKTKGPTRSIAWGFAKRSKSE